jgi:hypothetical protein
MVSVIADGRVGSMGAVAAAALEALLARRDEALRLRPELALGSLEEAQAFVRERGVVTLTASCSLPSLYGACHEEPYKPGGKGFAAYPKTKWPWGFELRARPGIQWLRLLRGKGVFLGETAVAAADPLCLEGLALAEAGVQGEEAARVVAHLAAAGPSLLDELKEELGLSASALRQARSKLERVGAVTAREVVLEDGGRHRHTSELRRWDQLESVPAGAGGLGELVVAGIRAAVVAPEREAARWFSWFEEGLVERLVDDGRLVRPEPGWLATP